MPKIQYIEKQFGKRLLDIIDKVNLILDEYEADGIDLTVRQVYYQFVSRDWIANTMKEYKRLASIIDDARLAGLIDWDRIQDRTRFLRTISCWSDPASIIRSCVNSYQEDLWLDQPSRIEVWIEKDAQIGNVEAICETERVPFLSCRGYTSSSEMWRAAQRLMKWSKQKEQAIHIIHLGDHDPSGIDMSRDIQDRLDLFSFPGCIEVHRIALNMDQVKRYNPPPNPAKLTDSRATNYIKNFGDDSWELDALSPRVVQDLIRKTILSLRDKAKWKASLAQEAENKQKLSDIEDNFEAVTAYVAKLKADE